MGNIVTSPQDISRGSSATGGEFMQEVVSSLVATIIGEPASVVFASATVWLLSLVSGWVIVNQANADEGDWNQMVLHLPMDVTYHPGDTEPVGTLELTYIPYNVSRYLIVVAG